MLKGNLLISLIKKIFIADEIQRSAVTALVAAADKNQLLISEVGSGKI